MKFLIAERISANKYKTPEGYLVCVDSVLARTGKQTYRKNEIFVDCNDDTEIEVDRKPEEVFSEATLASFENKPITIEHPDEDVNTGNFKNLAVGFVRDIHRGKDNGQDVMLGTLVITDEEAISAIESGELLDLSCGYDCDIEDSANPQQRNIRGNHVALCENGRAGIARIVDSVNDATMKEYIFKFIPNEFTSKPVEVKFPCLNNELALATLRRSWTWIKMISVTVDGKEVKYQNGKIIDSEETEMKDKLIDIPSDIQSKIESLFKARNIKITGKGKTWTGRVHYQVEFVGKAIDLKKKLDLIEKQVESLKIPMTYAIGNNKDDTLATAGVDFDKQSVDDSDVEDGKNAAENVVESAMKELGITKEQLSSKRKEVEMKISSKGLYGRTQAGWFVDDYIKNYCKDSEELISDDEDIFTKAINDEVTAIELYNQILAGDLDDETRAIIEEIRDDENDHLVKLTKLKNNTVDENDVVEDKHIKDGKYVSDLKIGDIIRLKDGSKWKVAFIRKSFLGIQVRMNSLSTPVITKEVTYNPTDMLAYDSMKDEEVEDAIQTFEIRWIDTYKKSKGYVKEEYLHVDKIKADSLSEALKKLADDVALAGVGTMNAMIVSIRSDKASYMYSGKLGELVRKVKDSSKIERAIKAIRAMRKL